MKVTDLKVGEVILCRTEGECEAILDLMHEAWLKWHDGTSYKENRRMPSVPIQCYEPAKWIHSNTNWYKVSNWYTIYPASLFINDKPMTTLTLDIAKQMVTSWIPSLKAFAIENFPELNPTPKRIYEGFYVQRRKQEVEYVKSKASNPALIRPTKESAEAAVAMSILLQKYNVIKDKIICENIYAIIRSGKDTLTVSYSGNSRWYTFIFNNFIEAERFLVDNAWLFYQAKMFI